jgi:anti-sigma-K factor RskA
MMRRHRFTCAQFVDLAEAFALGALGELEHRACAQHIARSMPHHGCREAFARASEVMDRLAAALPGDAPPPELWSAIEARLGVGSPSSNAEWL